jgi:hypothetical protein
MRVLIVLYSPGARYDCWHEHSSRSADKTQHFFSNFFSRLFAILSESRRILEQVSGGCAVVTWRRLSLTTGVMLGMLLESQADDAGTHFT